MYYTVSVYSLTRQNAAIDTIFLHELRQASPFSVAEKGMAKNSLTKPAKTNIMLARLICLSEEDTP